LKYQQFIVLLKHIYPSHFHNSIVDM